MTVHASARRATTAPHAGAAEPGPATAALDVRDLVVEFDTDDGPLRALDHVSFSIARGEVLGVVGESGAGKSLTGMAVSRMIQPPGRIAGGEIWLAGKRIDQLPRGEMRRIRGKRIGMIFQDPMTSLNPLFTVGDQLAETMGVHLGMGRKAGRRRAVDLLDEVGVPSPSDRVDAYPHELSGGMRQRVVIALAMCAEPELIIADEPTTALDVAVQAQILDLLARICRDHGTSMMLVTHDMGVIADIADRVAVMYAGRMVEIGSCAEVTDAALHPYSRGLMGAIPTLEDRGQPLVQIPGTMPRLSAIPDGCSFHPRCDKAFARCRTDRPEPLAVGDRRVACHLYDDLAPEDAQ
ncbi:ABC transporter ATP-binding protein [Pseudoroseicyclus tamaricis]|uniref:ABC transporter ATP-binding protein n=1 Tax=Pseudoroseicyclus tamaricis TaxID=2705421 RepID=A0A6B2JYV4_9RHOB|nr:ABC transporter ATP-binding protein [Pseudoroseicyclus tamaricis]NDV00552.1 ABC transporter ATP-binding protein [Pseudoroseicyclus tamaricis]